MCFRACARHYSAGADLQRARSRVDRLATAASASAAEVASTQSPSSTHAASPIDRHRSEALSKVKNTAFSEVWSAARSDASIRELTGSVTESIRANGEEGARVDTELVKTDPATGAAVLPDKRLWEQSFKIRQDMEKQRDRHGVTFRGGWASAGAPPHPPMPEDGPSHGLKLKLLQIKMQECDQAIRLMLAQKKIGDAAAAEVKKLCATFAAVKAEVQAAYR